MRRGGNIDVGYGNDRVMDHQRKATGVYDHHHHQNNLTPSATPNAGGNVAAPSSNDRRRGYRNDPVPLMPSDADTVFSNETETRPGAQYVNEGISSSRRGGVEREDYDLDTLAGNTTVVQAEQVADGDRYEELERRVQQEVLRRLQTPAVASSTTTATTSRQDTSQPAMATVIETETTEIPEGGTKSKQDRSDQREVSSRSKLLIGLGVVGVIVVILVVIILVFALRINNDGGSTDPTETPTPTPLPTASSTSILTSAPTTVDNWLQYLADIVGVTNINTIPDDSPEIRSLQWMAFEDPLRDEMVTLAESSGGTNRLIIERYALGVLYFATNGTLWQNQYNFLSGTSICEWNNGIPLGEIDDEGVYCNEEGEAISIELDGNGLEGTLPSQVGEFISLSVLYVSGNSLFGTIPSSLGTLTELTSLSACCNDFSGAIPEALGQLVQLSYLAVNSNQLTGTIPASLGALAQLSRLDLLINQLTGTIPASLATLFKLEEINISFNQLTGTIPSEFQFLTTLRSFILHRNDITGDFNPIFCPGGTLVLQNLVADCGGPNPDIICSCCSTCL